MIDMSELLYDQDFCEEFKILRSSGEYINHRWEPSIEIIHVTGIAAVVSSKDFDMLPEGDRVSGLRTFYTMQELRGSSNEATADICEYHGQKYRLFQVLDHSNNGFYKAIGKLIGGV